MKRYFPIILIIAIFGLINLVNADTVIKPVRILIVPGHDNEVYGAKYKNIKEADMALVLGEQLYNILKSDDRFIVYITRDKDGYTKDFADYFANNISEIETFKDNAKKITEKKIADGTFVEKSNGVPHYNVKAPVALKLYGINKWVDDNKIDAVIHLHFNDDGRKNKSKPGPYEGFSVYMPDVSLASHDVTKPLAINIFNKLKKKYTNSTLIKENGGVIADQKLIVMGANNTLLPTVRSVLIEYGFIYEKKFRTYPQRKVAYQSMADLTASGIIDYFFPIKQ